MKKPFDVTSRKRVAPEVDAKDCECGSYRGSARHPHQTGRGCDITISIAAHGDVNIYNCSAPPSRDQDACDDPQPPCRTLDGACIPVVAGAKHKLSRAQRLEGIAARALVPSSLAASTLHMLRRFVSGKAPASTIEASVFPVFANMPIRVRDVMKCAAAAYDELSDKQRERLFGALSNTDVGTPLAPGALSDAWTRELTQRLSQQLFDNTTALDGEVPGKIRVYEPQGEDFFSQVRICSINSLRTANFLPTLSAADYLPAEVQQDCAPVVTNGQTQVVCQVRTADCPGNPGPGFCARVLDVAPGDSLLLQGVNYFSVDAKVRLVLRETGSPTRDVDGFVVGDVTTPVTDAAGVLINDCRVKDRLTFIVPSDLPAGIYQIQVAVPNITGIAALGSELVSNSEFINLLPPADARFNVVAEQIHAREETSPSWFGSDEIGLHTMSTSLRLDGTLSALPALETDFQGDFDTGDTRDITRNVFAQQEPLKALIVVVTGFEIDSQHAYDQLITTVSGAFWDALEYELPYIAAATAALVTKFGWWGLLAAAIGIAITALFDLFYALWAPADPIIFDSIGLSINDLIELTSPNYPLPAARTLDTQQGIIVNVWPLEKIPSQYRERREYVSDEQESRYEIIYRVNRVA